MVLDISTALILASFQKDLELALTLILFIWLFNWLKTMAGDARIAIILAAIISYIVFFQYPETIWLVVAGVVLITYGKQINAFLGTATRKTS